MPTTHSSAVKILSVVIALFCGLQAKAQPGVSTDLIAAAEKMYDLQFSVAKRDQCSTS